MELKDGELTVTLLLPIKATNNKFAEFNISSIDKKKTKAFLLVSAPIIPRLNMIKLENKINVSDIFYLLFGDIQCPYQSDQEKKYHCLKGEKKVKIEHIP